MTPLIDCEVLAECPSEWRMLPDSTSTELGAGAQGFSKPTQFGTGHLPTRDQWVESTRWNQSADTTFSVKVDKVDLHKTGALISGPKREMPLTFPAEVRSHKEQLNNQGVLLGLQDRFDDRRMRHCCKQNVSSASLVCSFVQQECLSDRCAQTGLVSYVRVYSIINKPRPVE